MPLKDKLQGYLNQAEQKVNSYLNPQSQPPPPVPQYARPNAPPVPYGSKPGAPPPPAYSPGPHYGQQQQQWGPPPPQQYQPPPQAYWQPQFLPHEPVSKHFKHELGQHGWGNEEAENYTADPRNSFNTSDGALVVHALIDNSQPGQEQKYTSARLSSHQTLSRCRGMLSARIRGPVAPGIWPAFWMLPCDPFKWPGDGEVDIAELWNGDRTNHSCLHWGSYSREELGKHRVIKTPIQHIDSAQGVKYDFVWDEDESTGAGKMVWYIDGQARMKAWKPAGTRRMSEFRILINIAIGGTVCKGVMPNDGMYEMVVRELAMYEEPHGGWGKFEWDFNNTQEGGLE